MSQLHRVCPRSRCMSFPSLHCSGSRLLCWELSEGGPGLSALPRTKSLMFRFSGTPQRCRLDWACVLCPSPVGADQMTRCLASAVAPSLPHPSCSVFWVYYWRDFSGALCLFWGADLWLQPSWKMSTIWNPKKSWLARKPACSLVDDASLGPPSGSGCLRLLVSSGRWASLQLAISAQFFVL